MSDKPKENCLIIMAKPPILGKAKTRLAKDIGKEKALLYYEKMLDRTFEISTSSNWDVIVYWTENHSYVEDINLFNSAFQVDGDLGDKMKNAFEQTSKYNYKKMVMIGTDCPDNSKNNIQEAFDHLNTSDLILGPSHDGGYYLIGMKTVHSCLFSDITWSTEKVLNQTLAAAEKNRLSFKIVKEINDIDDLKDLNSSDYFSL